MKHSTSCLLFLSCLMFLTPLYAATQTLTTYYPAPQGNYNNVTVNSGVTLPAPGVACVSSGNNIYLANSGGQLEICDSSGVHTFNSGGTWTGATGGGNTWLYPSVGAGADVTIGGNTDPGNKLNVIGSMGVSGAATIGGAATVTGAATLSGGATITGALSVSGNTTLGTNAANTTTINGSATVTGASALQGGTTVNASAAAPTSGIIVCSGGNCGEFVVAWDGTTSKYYAAYAP